MLQEDLMSNRTEDKDVVINHIKRFCTLYMANDLGADAEVLYPYAQETAATLSATSSPLTGNPQTPTPTPVHATPQQRTIHQLTTRTARIRKPKKSTTYLLLISEQIYFIYIMYHI